jgi:hypothetical protein
MNLVQNAMKFTYQGSIKVSLDYEAETKMIVGRVQDSAGIGASLRQTETRSSSSLASSILRQVSSQAASVLVSTTSARKSALSLEGALISNRVSSKIKGWTDDLCLQAENSWSRTAAAAS